ncbi:MAG: Hsp20/alpha crystallin family protein [Ignavibacteriaceae bacterium]|jgi:HSP20 family protein
MTYIKFGPASDFDAFNKKIHNFFDEMPNIGVDINYSVKPRTDFYSDEYNVYIDVEIPGVKKEDIKILLKDNILTLSGEKKDLSKKNPSSRVVKSERTFGPFNRSFELPNELNTDSIEATFSDGILTITIAKKTQNNTQEKEIKIN